MILEHEVGTRAGDLNLLIDLSKELSIWSEDGNKKLNAAIQNYARGGLEDEYENCSDADEYEQLREELGTLGEQLKVAFDRYVDRIEQRLVELGPADDENRDWGGWRRSDNSSGGELDTDDAIRDVFGTLLD